MTTYYLKMKFGTVIWPTLVTVKTDEDGLVTHMTTTDVGAISLPQSISMRAFVRTVDSIANKLGYEVAHEIMMNGTYTYTFALRPIKEVAE